MNHLKRKAVSLLLTAAMATGSMATVFGAQFTTENVDDGFSLGYYTDTADQAEKDKTVAAYDQRPMMPRQMEALSRGLTAVPGADGVLVSWRFLGTDSKALQYNLYRGTQKLNAAPMSLTNYFDENGKPGEEYTLAEVVNGEENGTKTTVKAWDQEYISFPVKDYGDGLYIIDDASAGDLDGDGEYEIVVRRTPVDMNVETRTVYPLIEAYKMDGTHLWTVDLGPNEINEVDVNFMVYDMDGDGKSEVMMRSFEGTTDGKGTQIGDTNKDGITDYSKDPANLAIFTDRQYIISTPEFVSMYDGATGAEIARTDMLPERGDLSQWSYNYTDAPRLTKRASHFLMGIAYLDGVTPSLVSVRGAWDNVRVAAWHIQDGQFAVDWKLDTPNKEDLNSIWGAVNHNISIADVDFDGKDEIFSGPMGVDHDGTTMYAVQTTDNDGTKRKLGHGDAFDLARMDPDYDGYLVWACHETKNLLANIELHDARTGQVLWGYSKNKDTGRSRAGDIDPTYKGFEVWGSTGTVPMNVSGEKIADNWNQFRYQLPDGTYETDEKGNEVRGTLPMNFKVYWDGDLLSEFLDGVRVSKWDWNNKEVDVLFDAEGCQSNGGTKAVPCLSADLFGDWREEIVWKTADEKQIRIYSTDIPTDYKLPTLMHDSYYRSSVALQNNHYNQPPNVSYYLGAETTEVPVPEIYTVKDGKELKSPDLTGQHAGYSVKMNESLDSVKEMKLLVNSPNAYVDEDLAKVDENDTAVVPVIVEDRTLVPVRFISEKFGLKVDFDDAARKITISGRGHYVEMTLDSKEYVVDGQQKTLDVPAQVYNDRTLIPLRAMAEAIGKQVFWDGRGLIVISKEEFKATDQVEQIISVLTTGEKPAPTPTPIPPTPTPAPDPLETMPSTPYTDEKGTAWDIYIDEDFSSYALGDSAGWAGTKPAPLDIIKVVGSPSGKAIQIGGSSKGNRNAIYTLPAPMTKKARIEFDWQTGSMKGGTSSGELRFADSSNNVFLAFSTQAGVELKYNQGGKISNGPLETGEWKEIGSGFKKDERYHVVIIADFEQKKASFTISLGEKKATVEDVPFTNGSDFGAIEVLAVREGGNFDWTTELSNIKIGRIAD